MICMFFQGRRLIAAAVALAILAISGRTAAADEAVARVGGVDVSGAELRAYLDSLGAQEKAAIAKDPALLTPVVRSYLARQAVLKEARAKKWDQEPSTRAQLDRLRDQALAELYLDSVSQPPASYPSDAEVQAAYDANQATFQVPRQFRIAQIFVGARKGEPGEDAARKRVDELAKKLERKGADFAALAASESDDKAAGARGGEIGWLAEGQIVPGIRATVTGLAPGAVSAPVRLDDGWHVVKLLETKAAFTRTLAEVRGAVAAQLRAERAKANRQAFLAKLLEQNPPAINELALSKLVKAER